MHVDRTIGEAMADLHRKIDIVDVSCQYLLGCVLIGGDRRGRGGGVSFVYRLFRVADVMQSTISLSERRLWAIA